MDAPLPQASDLLGLVARLARLTQAVHALERKLQLAAEGRDVARVARPARAGPDPGLRSIQKGDWLLVLVGTPLHQLVQQRDHPLGEVHTLASLLTTLTDVVAPLVGHLEPAVERAAPSELVDHPRVQWLVEALHVARQWNVWLAELAQQVLQLEAGDRES